jgi:hypothetical protein
MRRMLIVAALVLLAVPNVAAAKTKVDTRELSKFRGQVVELRAKVDRKLGRRAGGRDIVANGILKANGRARPATTREVRDYRDTLRRMIAPPPAPVAVPSTTYGVQPATPATSSGGGSYCGLFQFDAQTWGSVGGSGSPCAASPAEQWARARELQRQRGNQPWPVCGAHGESLDAIARCESGGNPGAVG